MYPQARIPEVFWILEERLTYVSYNCRDYFEGDVVDVDEKVYVVFERHKNLSFSKFTSYIKE